MALPGSANSDGPPARVKRDPRSGDGTGNGKSSKEKPRTEDSTTRHTTIATHGCVVRLRPGPPLTTTLLATLPCRNLVDRQPTGHRECVPPERAHRVEADGWGSSPNPTHVRQGRDGAGRGEGRSRRSLSHRSLPESARSRLVHETSTFRQQAR